MQQAEVNGRGFGLPPVRLEMFTSVKAEEAFIGDTRLSVPAGQKLDDLLNTVSSMLGVAHDMLEDLAMTGNDERTQRIWAAIYLLRVARASNEGAVLSRFSTDEVAHDPG